MRLNSRIKVLFLHNSLAEYRIAFWNSLNEKVDLEIVVTNQKLDNAIYGLQKGNIEANVKIWSDEIVAEVKKYDVVILPPPDRPKEFIIGIKLIRECRKNGIPTLFWTETWFYEGWKNSVVRKLKNVIHEQMIKKISRSCSVCIAAGSMSSKYLSGINVPDEKIRIAIDSSTSPESGEEIDVYKKYNIPKDKKVVLFFARLVKRKGLSILIKAFEQAKLENTILLVCGEGETRKENEQYVRDHGLENCVIFTGKIQPKQRRDYFKSATVYVLPSLYDVWGLTVNEALEVGTPVIVTKAVGAGYDLIDEDTGMVVQENDICAMKNALIYVCKEKMYSREKIKSVYSKYDIRHMADSFYNIILEATNK